MPCSRCAGLSPWAKPHDSEVPAARGHHPARFGIRRWWWVRCCPCCGSRNRHRVGIPTGGRREVLGRVVGAAPGVVVVEVVSAVREWAPLMDVRPAFGAPVAGALVGLLAGLCPSLWASRMEPVDALCS